MTMGRDITLLYPIGESAFATPTDFLLSLIGVRSILRLQPHEPFLLAVEPVPRLA